MTTQFEHILQIRRDEFWLEDSDYKNIDNPQDKRLKRLIDTLAYDLNTKETHFLLELIQNAEDNDYENGVKPKLTIKLLKEDPTETPGSDGALLIINNEKGFNKENISSICDVGKSSKKNKKTSGYIGEKGIGFKSVFKITSCPYIFSGGYQIRLPKEVEDSEIGYIVPEWVARIPENLDINQTNILLPLDVIDYNYQAIEKMLRDFSPMTFLFLHRLTELEIIIDEYYELSITKEYDEKEKLLSLMLIGNDNEKRIEKIDQYLYYDKEYAVPEDINESERHGVEITNLSIAFPYSDESVTGCVYAYLPVYNGSGLPFNINADFLLTSSRDTVHEDKRWNCWLRDSIVELFYDAFLFYNNIPKYESIIFKYIPLE
nr:ATP-binding protein [Candidatus Cloacimonadota bacterium]